MQINRANDYKIETQFAKEGDYNGRELVVQITNAGEVSNQTGVSLNLGWHHNVVGNSGLDPFTTVDASKGIFKITYPTEMLTAGNVTASIQVLESGKITLTRNFEIIIEQSPIDESVIVSENSFTALQEALVKVNGLEDNYAPRLNEVSTRLAQTTKNIESKSINVLYLPDSFIAAKGDGVTDDTNALQELANSLNEFDTLYFPASIGLYKITDTLFLKGNTNVVMDGEIGYFNSDFKTAVQYGDENTHTRGTTLKFNVRRNVISDWSDENSIGVKLINVMESNIDIERIYGFTIGFQGIGISDGFCYNNTVIKTLLDNKIHIDVTSDLSGWSNENVFIGGRFANRSTINPEKSRYGVRITSRDEYYQNANLFIKPSFEMNHKVLPEGQEALPVLVEYGNFSKFEFCRNEGNGKIFARHKNKSNMNTYSTSIGTCVVDNSESSERLFLAEDVSDFIKSKSKPIFNSGFLPSKAYLYKGSDNVTVLNNSLFKGYQDTGDERMFFNYIAKTDEYLEFTSTNGIGRKVKLGKSKRLLIKRSCVSQHHGRIVLKIFDINGQSIIDTTKQRIFADYNTKLLYTNNFGRAFTTQSDVENDLSFTFSDDVDSVNIILAGGTNPLRIKSYDIYSFDGDGSSIINFYDSEIPILPEIPTAGTWGVGDKIYFENPTSHIGAICTIAGTPGTWNTFGAITT